jgi:hypothetical protein
MVHVFDEQSSQKTCGIWSSANSSLMAEISQVFHANEERKEYEKWRVVYLSTVATMVLSKKERKRHLTPIFIQFQLIPNNQDKYQGSITCCSLPLLDQPAK